MSPPNRHQFKLTAPLECFQRLQVKCLAAQTLFVATIRPKSVPATGTNGRLRAPCPAALASAQVKHDSAVAAVAESEQSAIARLTASITGTRAATSDAPPREQRGATSAPPKTPCPPHGAPGCCSTTNCSMRARRRTVSFAEAPSPPSVIMRPTAPCRRGQRPAPAVAHG
jgi:hypothetical protein